MAEGQDTVKTDATHGKPSTVPIKAMADSTGQQADGNKDLGIVEKSTDTKTPLHTISNMETMIHLLKGNMGTGLYTMPLAFMNAGIWTGFVLLAIIAYICTHCWQLLVESALIMKTRDSNFECTYGDLVETACLTGSKQFAKYAKVFRHCVNVIICFTQFGFCCVYIVFTSTNLKQVVDHYAPDLQWDVRVFMVLLTIPIIFLGWIRSMKVLAPISLVANVLQSLSIIVVFYYIFRDPLPPVSDRPAFGSPAGLPLFFATTVFTFEGDALVLPIQREMRSPAKLLGLTGILSTGMVIITSIYIAMGFYGYLQFGDCIEASITLNLPQDELLAQLTKLFLILAVFGNYAMQFYVPIPMIWPSLSKYVTKCIKSEMAAELAFRTTVVLITLMLAATIPKIDLFITLVGAIGSACLALVFPPILDLVTHWPNVSRWTVTKDILILVFGVLGFATGTYSALRDIIIAFSGQESTCNLDCACWVEHNIQLY